MFLELKIQRQLRATTVKNGNDLEYIEFPILFRLPLTFKRGHLFYDFLQMKSCSPRQNFTNFKEISDTLQLKPLVRLWNERIRVKRPLRKRKSRKMVSNIYACEKCKLMPRRYRASAPDDLFCNQDVCLLVEFPFYMLYARKHTYLERMA